MSNPFATATARKARVLCLRRGADSVIFLNKKGQPESCPLCTALVPQGKLCQLHQFNNNILSWRLETTPVPRHLRLMHQHQSLN
uniref:Uncharacterized protein n=1 Tax=Bird gammacoronavirus AnasCN24 TaxID=3237959 RepID=A0AB39AEL6_9GAMC